MTKQQMIDQLNVVTSQLEYADNARPTDDSSRVAIGALIIAIDHLHEVVRELVEEQPPCVTTA
jgi:hypothetical protein